MSFLTPELWLPTIVSEASCHHFYRSLDLLEELIDVVRKVVIKHCVQLMKFSFSACMKLTTSIHSYLHRCVT